MTTDAVEVVQVAARAFQAALKDIGVTGAIVKLEVEEYVEEEEEE